MKNSRTRPSLGRRVLGMFLTWLFLGALIGVVGGMGMGGGRIEIVCMMIGGMAVLPIVGVVLGLIGGDCTGSVVGAVGGLLACWITGCFGTVPSQPQITNVIVIFGALVGATGFLFAQFLLWKYGLMFRTICWMVGVTPSSAKAWALVAYRQILHKACSKQQSRRGGGAAVGEMVSTLPPALDTSGCGAVTGKTAAL